MQIRHAHVLAQARTYLAALADEADGDDPASAYEHVLIVLDRIHCDESPDVYPDTYRDALSQHRDIQFELATAAIEELKAHGVDPLSVELVLCMLQDAYTQDCV